MFCRIKNATLWFAVLPGFASCAAHAEDKSWSAYAAYTGEVWSAASGGINSDIRYLDNFDAQLEVDLEEAFGVHNTQLFFYGLYNNGETFSDAAGDGQVISNIEAGVRSVRLFEAWVAHSFTPRLSAKVGLYDINSEFSVLEAGDLFIHSAHGIGSVLGLSGQNGPSIFPSTGFGARGQYQFSNDWAFRVAIVDAVPGDLSNLAATNIRLDAAEGALFLAETEIPIPAGRFIGAHWRYTQRFETIDGSSPAVNAGWYAGVERVLWQNPNNSEAGIRGFLRAGRGTDEVNPFDHFLGCGFRFSGFSKTRPEDELGVALATAFTSSANRASTGAEPAEYALEFTYKMRISDFMNVQPDLQYIINPSANPDINNTVALGLRFQIFNTW